ncbi:MAG: chromate transporter [bacterium]|nr:chromate transporter [bacterium]
MSMLTSLILAFFKVGLFSYGGGYAAIALIMSEIVQRNHWLTEQQLVQAITLSGMVPGAIAINCAALAGYQITGIPGSVVAVVGVILPSIILATLASHFYGRLSHMGQIQSMMAMLRPAVLAILILATVKLMGMAHLLGPGLMPSLSGLIFPFALIAIFRFRLHPLIVILLAGLAGLFIGTLTV